MTIPPETRDLTLRLLTCEAISGNGSEPGLSASIRVYEKLRQSLIAFAGVAGFQSLASRALALARSEDPGLGSVKIAADGSLRGLSEFVHQAGCDKDQSEGNQGIDGEVILLARLLGLLLIFLGESLTLRLLHDAWPEADFDDHNLGHGRKA